MRAINERRVFGQLEHPSDGKSNLGMAAVIITNLDLRENGEVFGTLETMSTDPGRTAKAIFDDGLTIGISSRARGSVKHRPDGIAEVQMEDFYPETFDLVAEPSTPGAYLHESVQNEMSQKDATELRRQEHTAIAEVQLEALEKDVLNEEYTPRWNQRLNDIKFYAKNVNEMSDRIQKLEDTLSEKMTQVNLLKAGEGGKKNKKGGETEYSKQKHKLRKWYATERDKLYSDNAYQREQLYIRLAKELKTTPKAAEYSPKYRDYRKKERERLDRKANAKVQHIENRYRGELARLRDIYKVKTWESIEEEIMMTQFLQEQEATATPTVPIPVTEVSVPVIFSDTTEAFKKKYNIFRPGEPTSGLCAAIEGDLSSQGHKIKGVTCVWEDDRMMINVRAEEEAENTSSSIIAAVQELIAEGGQEVPLTTAVVEPTDESVKLLAKEKKISDLREHVANLIKENERLVTENNSLRVLNDEMTVLFERKLVEYELNSLLRHKPELEKFRPILKKSTTVTALKEAALELQATITPTDKIKESVITPPPPKKEKSVHKRLEEEKKRAGTVTDGSAHEKEDVFTRMCEFRKKC